MAMNRAALGVLALAGVVVAGAGSYFVLTPATDAVEPTASANFAPPVAGAVTETENVIAPETAPVLPAPKAAQSPAIERPRVDPPVARTTPARRTEPDTRSRPAARPAEEAVRAPAPAPAPEPQRSADVSSATAIQPVAENTTVEIPAAPMPPPREFEDLVIPTDSVIGLQIDTAVTTERAKVEDAVLARVTRDVKVGDRVAIPAGARAEGSITLVERGGRLKDRARLGIRFHSVVLADGTKLNLDTETIYRDGDSPAKESAAKIGGATVGGAILGAIFGGKKGAAIGGAVGAAGGGAAVAASDPNPAALPAGTTVTARISSPVTVTVEK